jgi:hydrogenase maturation protease
MKTLVLGLGNPLLRDDAVGIRVAERLKPLLADEVDIEVDVDYWGGLRLMERMVGYERAIVIDAILSGAEPGTLHVLSPGELPTQRSASAHDVNLLTALKFGRQAGVVLPADDDITLIGIEAVETIEFGEELTAEVAAAIPKAVEVVLQLLDLSPVDDA